MEEVKDQNFCALRINNFNENTLSFLLSNPFMFRGKKAIKGVAFVDHKLTEAEQNKLISTYLFPKLESLIVMGYYDKIVEEKNEIELSLKSQNHAVTLEKNCQESVYLS